MATAGSALAALSICGDNTDRRLPTAPEAPTLREKFGPVAEKSHWFFMLQNVALCYLIINNMFKQPTKQSLLLYENNDCKQQHYLQLTWRCSHYLTYINSFNLILTTFDIFIIFPILEV